jgi:Conjugative transposon protein TcpC
VWAGRSVIWAVLILIGYRGVLAIVGGPRPVAPAVQSAGRVGGAFPETLAAAYALQFGSVYLNFSPSGAALRSRQLSRFLPPGPATQLGWNGAGTQRLLSEQVASVSLTGRHTAIVTLLARVDEGRMLELAVPVYADNGALSVSADPALLPAPATARPPAPGTADFDPAAQAVLQSQLPDFFQAYASGDRATLARFALPGTHLAGLDGAVRFGGIDSLYAPPGGARRAITVTVTWDLAAAPAGSGGVAAASAALQMTYQMTVVRQHGSWDVQAIGASTGPRGAP